MQPAMPGDELPIEQGLKKVEVGEALFHEWSLFGGHAAAIIEFEDGSVKSVIPEMILFIEPAIKHQGYIPKEDLFRKVIFQMTELGYCPCIQLINDSRLIWNVSTTPMGDQPTIKPTYTEAFDLMECLTLHLKRIEEHL